MTTHADIVSQVLEKMIDSQITNTEALVSLKHSADESAQQIKGVSSFFSNGFREDIRIIKTTLEQTSTELKELKELRDCHTALIEASQQIEDMSSFFSNGFREDIRIMKTTLEQACIKLKELRDLQNTYTESLKHLDEKIDSFKQAGFWIKVIAGFIAAIAIIAGAVAQILQ